MVTCGISSPFGELSPTSGQVTYVLLSRSPLTSPLAGIGPFDLHVLCTPPAFVLSQDQTLRQKERPPVGDRFSFEFDLSNRRVSALMCSCHSSSVKDRAPGFPPQSGPGPTGVMRRPIMAPGARLRQRPVLGQDISDSPAVAVGCSATHCA